MTTTRCFCNSCYGNQMLDGVQPSHIYTGQKTPFALYSKIITTYQLSVGVITNTYIFQSCIVKSHEMMPHVQDDGCHFLKWNVDLLTWSIHSDSHVSVPLQCLMTCLEWWWLKSRTLTQTCHPWDHLSPFPAFRSSYWGFRLLIPAYILLCWRINIYLVDMKFMVGYLFQNWKGSPISSKYRVVAIIWLIRSLINCNGSIK